MDVDATTLAGGAYHAYSRYEMTTTMGVIVAYCGILYQAYSYYEV